MRTRRPDRSIPWTSSSVVVSAPKAIVSSRLLENRRHYLFDTALDVAVVGKRPDDCDLAGSARRNTLVDQLARVDQQPRADSFGQAVLLQVPHLLAKFGQLHRDVIADTRLVRDDLCL